MLFLLFEIDNDKTELLDNDLPRFDGLKISSQSKWIKWLYNQSRNPNMHPPLRNDAMQEFDNIYMDRFEYAIVAKSREYAPFVGLILTSISALSFYFSDLSNIGNLTTGDLVRRVLPLLSGVAFGALLNIICSVLLQTVNHQLSDYRQKAFAWFDEANAWARDILAAKARKDLVDLIALTNIDIIGQIKIYLNESWKATTLVQNQALENIKQIEQDSNELRESALETTKSARIACVESARAAKILGSTIEHLSLNLGPNIISLSETLNTNARQFQEFSENHAAELRSISESTHLLGQAWTSLYPEINTIVSGTKNLIESTRLFQEVLGPAADAIQSASQKYVQLTSEMSNSAQAVRGYSENLKSSLTTHSNVLESVRSSVQNTLIPSCSVLSNYAIALQQNSERLDSTTQQLLQNLETASMGSGRFENVAVQFEQVINNQILPAITSMGNLPNMMRDFFSEVQGAGKNLWNSSSAFRQIFEDHRNHVNLANTSITDVQILINNANHALSDLNKSAGSFSSIMDNFQKTAGLLSKVNDGLAPVPVELGEFLKELRKVAALSDNVTSLSVHLQKLNGVATELGNARGPLAEFATLVKSIEEDIKVKPPNFWVVFFKLVGWKQSK
jgi:hypothetical protein